MAIGHDEEETGQMRGRNVWAACAVVLLVSVVVPRGADAQWDAGASQQLGMGHGFTALSQSTMRNAMQTEEEGEADADARAAEAADTLARGARLDALAREYAERRTRDGRVQADAWAFERGRRDAQAGSD